MDESDLNNLPELDIKGLEEELRKEEKFGDRPVEAALGSAASAATLGLSDVLAVESGITDAERLREVRDRNATAATIGTAGGVIVPALATMGTSLPAQAASAGIKTITRTGLAAEQAALKALAPKLGQKTANVVAKGLGGATEGALAGAGQVVSDVALERPELSGESALATVGTGALLGAGFGAAFGTAQATLPPVTAKLSGLAKKVKNVAAEGVENITDPVEATLRVTTATPAQRLKLRESLGKNADYLPTYVKDELGLEVLSTPTSLLRKNRQVISDAGEQIGSISKRLDELTATGQVPVTRAEAYTPLLQRIDDIATKLQASPGVNRSEIKIANRYRDEIIAKGAADKPFSFTEYNDFRKTLQGKKFKGGGALESFEANLADAIRGEARDVIDQFAMKASAIEPTLGAGLQEANKKFHVGATLNKYLRETAERQTGFSTPVQFLIDTTARGTRNAAVVTDIAAKTNNVLQTIGKGVDNFFKPVPRASLPTGLASTQMLLNSGFSIDQENGKLPKTKEQAFQNIQKNVNELKADPDKLIDLIAKRTVRVSNADPGTAAAMQSTLAAAVQFLHDKMPRSAVIPGMFKRDYQPSKMEIAKFQRYLQVIEQPLTVLDDLAKGTLTREHVEALQAVYPEIYKEMQQKAMDKVLTTQNMPYNKKVQLSILLDIPADSSLSAQSILLLQQSISGQPAGDQPDQAMEADLPEDQVDIAERAQTGTEAIANRE